MISPCSKIDGLPRWEQTEAWLRSGPLAPPQIASIPLPGSDRIGGARASVQILSGFLASPQCSASPPYSPLTKEQRGSLCEGSSSMSAGALTQAPLTCYRPPISPVKLLNLPRDRGVPAKITFWTHALSAWTDTGAKALHGAVRNSQPPRSIGPATSQRKFAFVPTEGLWRDQEIRPRTL